MKDLQVFSEFMKPKDEVSLVNKNIIGYTRVSSKQQLDNYSIEEQEREIRSYAQKNNYILDEIIGGTYESASGDFSRKEFKKLYDQIKKSRKRPHAIAIKFINRFSRTGANAISLVQELVEKLGVHLIETSSGLSTYDIKQRMMIYHKLLEAQEENQERLERTIPGMKSFLKNGNWLGTAPFGYTTYGPRVVEFSNRRESQMIEIDDKGKILQKAWQWKLQGERDSVIIKKMGDFGIEISKQRLSDIWRNPFYCGVIVNSLLDDPLSGNWEPMVNQKDFLKVNGILKDNKSLRNEEASGNCNRPLSRFLICAQCGHKLTGYVVKKKEVHYYKCNVCRGVNLNANTTKRAFNPGLNETFKNLLQQIELDDKYIEPLTMQLKKMFLYLNSETQQSIRIQQRTKTELESKLQKLEEKYLFDDIDKTVYEKHRTRLLSDLNTISQNLDEQESKLSNHSEYIDKVIQVVRNISKYWGSGDFNTKDRIQKVVFPEGLVIDPENRTYLTNNINTIFHLTNCISEGKDVNIKKLPTNNDEESYQVAGTGLEPATFGL